MPVSKPLRYFFIKAFAFLLGAGLLLNLLGSLADRVAPLEDWRVEHQQRAADLENRRDRIEAITLGNSHSDAIDFSVLGMQGQSLAFGAADLFEVERYAAYLDDRLPNLRTVFIAISYYSFSRDNATYEPFRSRRIGYYSLVPTWTPIQGDLPNFLLGRLESFTHVMSVVRSDSWHGVWAGLVDPEASANPFPFDGVTTQSSWGTCTHYTAEQLQVHASEIARRNVTSSNQMAAIHPGLEQDAIAALVHTIEGLESKGIRVILFTPTYHETYNEYFMERGSAMLENMKLNMDTLQQNYHIEYYDFSRDPEIVNQAELFFNSDHLGDCGRKVFSTKLLAALNGKTD